MSKAILRALWPVLAALAIAGAVWAGVDYVRGLQSDLAQAKQDADAALKGNQERDGVIKTLRRNERANGLDRARLEGEIEGLRNVMSDRDAAYRRLENENAELRAWAAVPLPGAVIGLQNHAAITGAAGYKNHMRARNGLHSPGGSSAR